MMMRLLHLLVLFALCAPTAHAQVSEPAPAPPADSVPISQSLDRLAEIRKQMLDRQTELQSVRAAIKDETDEDARAELQRRADELLKTIDRLNNTFEQVATSGIDEAVLSEQPPQEFDWKEELLQITKPLISSLKDLTEKPRKIENLRSQLHRSQEQVEIIGKALASIERFAQAGPPRIVADKLDAMLKTWQQRKADAESGLELARYQLATLRGQDTSYWQMAVETTHAFVAGRGLTLALAVVAVLVVWVLARLILHLVLRFTRAASSSKKFRNRERGILYLYRLFVGIVAVIAVLVVFYARSDVLLLALTLIALAMATTSLRQTVPKYLKEIRILLDFGSVREGERIVYGGVPMEVKTIHTFAVLRNPDLEGVVRLPIDQLVDLVSRPAGEEPWFPSRVGEYLLLADGDYAEVVRQTIEFVELKIMDSLVQIPTAEFVQSGARNLSREGFAIRASFGIDYRHQAICLDPVPQRMHEAVHAALKASQFGAALRDLIVEFKEAGASSLDYLIYARLSGTAAGRYFAVQRLMQQALVTLCNHEGWVIPFGQLTIHQGDGFDGLRTASRGTH